MAVMGGHEIRAFEFGGRLVYFDSQCETEIGLKSIGYQQGSGFHDETTTKLTSKLSWTVEDVRQCVDDRTGTNTLVVLVTCKLSSGTGNRFRFLRANWKGGSVFCHTPNSSGKIPQVDLLPLHEFTYTAETFKSFSCALTYGPSAILLNGNKLLLFNSMQSHEKSNLHGPFDFLVCDDASTFSTQKQTETTTKILSVASEHDWIVALIVISGENDSTMVAVALEKYIAGFKRTLLNAQDFLPMEYASKVSTVTFQTCKRVVCTDQSGANVYENTCAVGLNDGYVMTFVNGIMQVCVTVLSPVGSLCPPVAITDVLSLRDLLVCHTDAKDCFVVSCSSNKVIHHWDNVDKLLIGDFLHSGGQHLLLLFEGWLPQQPDAGFLMTDLQGFVEDRREGEADISSQSDSRDDGNAGNLQGVTRALQEQNQTLSRCVSEEESRLVSKQVFLAQAWQRLHCLSLHGTQAESHISPPEVPLLSLLGGPASVTCRDRTKLPLTAGGCGILVQSLWHRIVDQTCVIGVKVLNTSDRRLKECVAVLTSPGATPTQSQPWTSSYTRVLRCFHANNTVDLSQPPVDHPKRQKVDSQIHVRQTDVIVPSESVTVTSTFDARDLGLLGGVKVVVYLQFVVEDSSDVLPERLTNAASGHPRRLPMTTAAGDSTALKRASERDMDEGGDDDVVIIEDSGDGLPVATTTTTRDHHPSIGYQRLTAAAGGSETLKTDSVVSTALKRGSGGTSTLKTDSAGSTTLEGEEGEEGGGRMRCVFGGSVVVTPAQLLQERGSLAERLADTTDLQLEEALLALSSMQQSWRCRVSFRLSEATVLPDCLPRAGFVFQGRLGQYLASSAAPACLGFVRLQLLGFEPLPTRCAVVAAFVRDSNQLLLLLQHLYAHLPDDASIALVTAEQRNSEAESVAQSLSAEQSEKRGLARRVT